MSEKLLESKQTVIKGELQVPGDKSISHRSIIFGSLAQGKTVVTNFLDGEDCMRTIAAFQAMGVSIEKHGQTVVIEGNGVENLQEPIEPINLGNSGTTARLLLGVLAGLPHHFTLFGDESLTNRPMDRVVIPLRQMGAMIDGRENGKYLPLAMRGGNLSSIAFETPVKSAQVKSGVLLAGLLAEGETTVTEKTTTRDHTENMLQAFGGKIDTNNGKISITGKQQLQGTEIHVPGDISSAAFFLVASTIVSGSELTIKDVGLNPTRTGIIDVLKQMDVDITVVEERTIGGEPVGSITVRSSTPKGIIIDGEIIPRIIDEIPIIALLATQANGKTIIRDAEELRYKESDRIASVVNTLQALGADIEATKDGMIIHGNRTLSGGKVDSYGDHRIGMMIAIASLITEQAVTLVNPACISISYPSFFEHLKKVSR
ncbi:3-phosphoshikimate 1-carboxyvinyltransferase [Aquibacillus koreensis]|uniref:3-phosphoshikimate 1-carboxyvinyltransferase n=1 Tax=Aquibacillus koreensis TaxID=279446 RepID=A0A9X4AHY7_9BACI|nr:3-phosphoshikimate 1-carboxyvinyltransferase [Aquibacillus koreensis]MCT2537379.1 3-phosphoshikimate 1-carboxyvinyltransferase [Aquibacillus koreensis]MDC3418825.1 3-phosphoshikimate 1-carboxyvinyltransferase [Aquibacillus koreensis]